MLPRLSREMTKQAQKFRVISMEFLRSFLRRHFVGKPVVESRTVLRQSSPFGEYRDKKSVSGTRKETRERRAERKGSHGVLTINIQKTGNSGWEIKWFAAFRKYGL